ncbi:MAG: hypothetical protein VYA69_14775 [Gemmatimonadota bacterium]|nr:hypothetical protein [Gemmatimonadota bacterium]
MLPPRLNQPHLGTHATDLPHTYRNGDLDALSLALTWQTQQEAQATQNTID